MADDEVNRLFLWGVPRTMTTAFTKCLSYVDGITIVNQPYAAAHYHGPDAEHPTPDPNNKVLSKLLALLKWQMEECKKAGTIGLNHSLMSYQWIRDELLQAPYAGKKILLCREQAHYLHGKYDMLPRGFKYSFIIRHPAKVFHSHKKTLTSVWGDISDIRTLPSMIFPPGCGFKELYDLVEYVRENINPELTIVDADDLLQDPAGILSTYCTRLGIPYSSELLSWEAGSDITSTWLTSDTMLLATSTEGWYKHAFESERFDRPTPIPDLTSLPEDVQSAVRFSMGYYESLYCERIMAS